MDDNNSNKKQKLEHLEGGIKNRIGTFGNIASVHDNVNQSNASTVDVCNSRERKSCAHTKNSLS